MSAIVLPVAVVVSIALGLLDPARQPTPPRQPAPIAERIPSSPAIEGQATWYRYVPGQAAAGPELRRALGPGWRGMAVRVCSARACVRVVLTDWCACHPASRLVDLDVRSFARLADPSAGIVGVSVSW